MVTAWLRRWWLVIGWMAVIFWLSSQPKPPFSGLLDETDWGDKIAHVVLYAVLGALAWRALEGTGSICTRWLALLGIAVICGFSDELHQLCVPGRDFDLLDLFADALGAALAAALLSLRMGGDDHGGAPRGREDLRGQGQAQGESGRHAKRGSGGSGT